MGRGVVWGLFLFVGWNLYLGGFGVDRRQLYKIEERRTRNGREDADDVGSYQTIYREAAMERG